MKVVKLMVVLPRETIAILELIAAREGKTKTQTLREAVLCFEWFLGVLRDPARRLLIEESGGVLREVEFGTEP